MKIARVLHAEIHGKLGRDALEHERIEDALTSSVWGTLFVADAWEVVHEWVARARDVAGNRAPPTDLVSEDHWYYFWPRLHEAEPDLLVRIGAVLFVIEIKYGARLSGVGVDEAGMVQDQLARQWRSVAPDQEHIHHYPREIREEIQKTTRRCVVYLVSARAAARSSREIIGSSALVPDAPILLLFWEELHAILLDRVRTAPNHGQQWTHELLKLLERRDLRAYAGVQWALRGLAAGRIGALSRLRRLQPAPWTPRFAACVPPVASLRAATALGPRLQREQTPGPL